MVGTEWVVHTPLLVGLNLVNIAHQWTLLLLPKTLPFLPHHLHQNDPRTLVPAGSARLPVRTLVGCEPRGGHQEVVEDLTRQRGHVD